MCSSWNVGFARASWMSLGSSGVVWFTFARPGSRCVNPGTLGSLTHATGVAGFTWCRRVHSLPPWGLLGSSVVIGFAAARRWG